MTTPSPDYEHEAARYDATRGGPARADAAAAAAARLLPAGGTVLDVGGGTGLVTSQLAGHGFRTVAVDRSPAMLALAAGRVPGRAVLADAGRLPFRDRCVDGVLLVWLLHLLPETAPVLAECVRVLRADGILVTTVDKAFAHGYDGADPAHAIDARRRVLEACARLGLVPAGETSFVGHGQGTGRGAGRAQDGGLDPVFPLLAFRRQPRHGEVSVAGPTVRS